jgi:hypothetical protein
MSVGSGVSEGIAVGQGVAFGASTSTDTGGARVGTGVAEGAGVSVGSAASAVGTAVHSAAAPVNPSQQAASSARSNRIIKLQTNRFIGPILHGLIKMCNMKNTACPQVSPPGSKNRRQTDGGFRVDNGVTPP